MVLHRVPLVFFVVAPMPSMLPLPRVRCRPHPSGRIASGGAIEHLARLLISLWPSVMARPCYVVHYLADYTRTLAIVRLENN